jgi:hypothetical protein
MQQVDAGIYTYIQLDGSWGLNNTGLIAGSRYAVIIDTLFTEPRNRAFREAVDGIEGRPLVSRPIANPTAEQQIVLACPAGHLLQVVKRSLKTVQYQPHLTGGCLAGTGLAVTVRG